jgi:uncharacterized protein
MGKCPYSCEALVNDGGGARGGSVPVAASGVIGELSFAACASGGVEVEAGAVRSAGKRLPHDCRLPRAKKKRGSKYDMAGYNLKVKRSRSGLGLYTFDPIKKGACIIEYTGRMLTPEENKTVENQYLFRISRTKTLDGSSRSNTARYINHSCRPNCVIEIYRGRIYILAKRHIKAGEELNYDYDTEFFDEWIKPKGCVCLKCKPQ